MLVYVLHMFNVPNQGVPLITLCISKLIKCSFWATNFLHLSLCLTKLLSLMLDHCIQFVDNGQNLLILLVSSQDFSFTLKQSINLAKVCLSFEILLNLVSKVNGHFRTLVIFNHGTQKDFTSGMNWSFQEFTYAWAILLFVCAKVVTCIEWWEFENFVSHWPKIIS